MKSLMNVDEAKEVCKNRSKWRVVSTYPKAKLQLTPEIKGFITITLCNPFNSLMFIDSLTSINIATKL